MDNPSLGDFESIVPIADVMVERGEGVVELYRGWMSESAGSSGELATARTGEASGRTPSKPWG